MTPRKQNAGERRRKQIEESRPGVLVSGEIYIAREFMARLLISRATFRWMRQNGLKVRVIRRAVYIAADDAIEWLTSQEYETVHHSSSPSPDTNDGSGDVPRTALSAI